MHVASEPGDYAFKKLPPHASAATIFGNTDETAALLQLEESLQVCGLYVIGEPDTIVEITMKHYDVNCETGALMAVSHTIIPLASVMGNRDSGVRVDIKMKG